MGKVIDLTGQRFGRLLVLHRGENSKSGESRWVCTCDCGNTKLVWGYSLRKGTTKSCGCLSQEQLSESRIKHNSNKTRLYNAWRAIKARTTNKNHKAYKDYGGRGIDICNEWKDDFSAFQKWALQNGYKDNLTIDRINNNKGYYPENCRWVDMQTQGTNRRTCHYLKYNGETKAISEWARQMDIRPDTLLRRLKLGWSVEKALTTPIKTNKKGNRI